MFLYKPFEFKQMLGSIVNLTTAKFALYQGIPSIFQMQHYIRFQIISVMIIRHVTV